MGNLLFSADGRIGSSEFIKGAVILLALNFFLWPSWFLGSSLGFIAILISLVSIYCWGCLFAKRFHDAGMGGGWFAVLLLLFSLLASIISFMIIATRLGVQAQSNPELLEKMNAIQTINRVNPDPQEIAAVMEFYGLMGKLGIIPTAITFLVIGGAIAFITNFILNTDPEPNRWG